ncbi:helix-turn-helix transcriptional regulator [Microbacterium testaceum]|uniref:helix-turn-helix transcriptional regulator n=1 Tax=Microbacterium testaceum TaxID=2033 RepID=UPI0012458B40|nr:WYL domain-containing protein [Microbacterium testaceum]
MPESSAPSTSRRLLSLLTVLQSRRDWSAAALAGRLAVSERTVRRDVDRLRELGYEIDSTRGPAGGYRLRAGAQLPPVAFDAEQAVTVAIALRLAAAMGGPLADAADEALSVLSRLLPEPLGRRARRFAVQAVAPAGAVGVDPAVLGAIEDAIDAGEEVRFDYSGSEGPARVTAPHHLLWSGGRWYLIGFTPERADWRVYRVDRMALKSHRGRAFTRREVPGGDPVRYLEGRFRGGDETGRWPCRGEVVVAASLAELEPYVVDGILADTDDGRTRVSLGSWSWGALAAECLRFDRPIADARPAALRQALAEVARRAAAAAAG